MAKKKGQIGPSIAVDGEKEFKAAIQNINKDMTVLSSEMKKATAQFEDNADSMEANKAKSKILQNQIETQTKKINVLKEALENSKKEYGENSNQVKEWQIKLNNAEGALSKTEHQLKQTTREIKDMNTAQKHSSRGTDVMNKSLMTSKNVAIAAAVAIGVALVAALKKAGEVTYDFIKDSVMLASDLAEVQNVVTVTFGKNTDVIDAWSKSAGAAFGISELAAKEYAGTLGSMYKAMGLTDEQILSMSKGLVGLTGDWASFRNATPEEAFEKAKAVVTGEGEALKEYGIIQQEATLNEYARVTGMKETYKNMDMAEKALLRYNYVMDMTKDVQGDYVRTSDGFSNRLKTTKLEFANISAEIGEIFIPTLNDLLGAGTTSLSGISAEIQACNGDWDKISEVISKALDDVITVLDEKSPEIEALIAGVIGLITKVVTENAAEIIEIGNVIGSAIAAGMWEGFKAGLPNIFQDMLEKAVKDGTGLSEWLTGINPTEVLNNARNSRTTNDGVNTYTPTGGKINTTGQVIINNNINGYQARDGVNITNDINRRLGLLD